MNLFVLRHGEAGSHPQGDWLRTLTTRGRVDVHHVISSRLSELSGVRDIWVSPYVRAQETALLAAELLPSCALITCDFLVPESSPRELLAMLEEKAPNGQVLIVSHQPLVGRFADMIVGSDPGFHPFDTATLAAFDISYMASGMARCCWMQHV